MLLLWRDTLIFLGPNSLFQLTFKMICTLHLNRSAFHHGGPDSIPRQSMSWHYDRFFSEYFIFLLPLIILSMLIYSIVISEVCIRPYQPAHYHNLDLISDPAFRLAQNKEVNSFLSILKMLVVFWALWISCSFNLCTVPPITLLVITGFQCHFIALWVPSFYAILQVLHISGKCLLIASTCYILKCCCYVWSSSSKGMSQPFSLGKKWKSHD